MKLLLLLVCLVILSNDCFVSGTVFGKTGGKMAVGEKSVVANLFAASFDDVFERFVYSFKVTMYRGHLLFLFTNDTVTWETDYTKFFYRTDFQNIILFHSDEVLLGTGYSAGWGARLECVIEDCEFLIELAAYERIIPQRMVLKDFNFENNGWVYLEIPLTAERGNVYRMDVSGTGNFMLFIGSRKYPNNYLNELHKIGDSSTYCDDESCRIIATIHENDIVPDYVYIGIRCWGPCANRRTILTNTSVISIDNHLSGSIEVPREGWSLLEINAPKNGSNILIADFDWKSNTKCQLADLLVYASEKNFQTSIDNMIEPQYYIDDSNENYFRCYMSLTSRSFPSTGASISIYSNAKRQLNISFSITESRQVEVHPMMLNISSPQWLIFSLSFPLTHYYNLIIAEVRSNNELIMTVNNDIPNMVSYHTNSDIYNFNYNTYNRLIAINDAIYDDDSFFGIRVLDISDEQLSVFIHPANSIKIIPGLVPTGYQYLPVNNWVFFKYAISAENTSLIVETRNDGPSEFIITMKKNVFPTQYSSRGIYRSDLLFQEMIHFSYYENLEIGDWHIGVFNPDIENLAVDTYVTETHIQNYVSETDGIFLRSYSWHYLRFNVDKSYIILYFFSDTIDFNHYLEIGNLPFSFTQNPTLISVDYDSKLITYIYKIPKKDYSTWYLGINNNRGGRSLTIDRVNIFVADISDIELSTRIHQSLDEISWIFFPISLKNNYTELITLEVESDVVIEAYTRYGSIPTFLDDNHLQKVSLGNVQVWYFKMDNTFFDIIYMGIFNPHHKATDIDFIIYQSEVITYKEPTYFEVPGNNWQYFVMFNVNPIKQIFIDVSSPSGQIPTVKYGDPCPTDNYGNIYNPKIVPTGMPRICVGVRNNDVRSWTFNITMKVLDITPEAEISTRIRIQTIKFVLIVVLSVTFGILTGSFIGFAIAKPKRKL